MKHHGGKDSLKAILIGLIFPVLLLLIMLLKFCSKPLEEQVPPPTKNYSKYKAPPHKETPITKRPKK